MPGPRTTKDLLSEHQDTASHRIDLKWGNVLVPAHPPQAGPSSLRTGKCPGHVDTDSRRIIVRSLYPRLLYAFSDVVCFVTTNARAAQTILEEMFSWAKDGHEKTLNQRVRPGLVIVLNKVPQESLQNLSSVRKATRDLLKSFERSARFAELRMSWRNRGKIINSAEDIIFRYYDSFRVISVPQHTNSPVTAGRISSQIKVLYGEIRSMATRIHGRKRQLSTDFDLDVSNLSASLVKSVEVLARDYKNTLDLHRLAVDESALPRDFHEHLLSVMWQMAKQRGLDVSDEIGGEVTLVNNMLPYIAACIVAKANSERGMWCTYSTPSGFGTRANSNLKKTCSKRS